MANRYSQVFTLTDIFSSWKLRSKLPLIRYREKELESGKISQTAQAKTVNRQVFDTAQWAAMPFYSPIKTTRSGNKMIIAGNLIGSHDGAVDAVYSALLSKKQIISMTANNVDVIRNAIKESERNRNRLGHTPKLYLRAQSLMEIKGMSNKQLEDLMNDVMENIMYGDDFPETQKKFSLNQRSGNIPYNYEQRVIKWKNKVGNA